MRPAALMAKQRADGWLAGTYDDGWTPTASYACVTGVAQMALCWLRLCQISGDQRATAMPRGGQLPTSSAPSGSKMRMTSCAGRSLAPRRSGARYSRFEFPNWAAKFFADALMMDMANVAVPPFQQRPRDSADESCCGS